MSRVLKITEPDGLYFVTCTVVNWIDVFTRLEYRKIVIDSLAHCQAAKGLRLHAYVVMSNHLHMIISKGETENTLTRF